ncbi:MAG TPA: hypothetical protein VGL08_14665 [Paraburkholderia sp.]|jgi:hypothetical protein
MKIGVAKLATPFCCALNVLARRRLPAGAERSDKRSDKRTNKRTQRRA